MKRIILTYKVNVALLGNTYRTMTKANTKAEAKQYASMWQKQGYNVQIEKIWTV